MSFRNVLKLLFNIRRTILLFILICSIFFLVLFLSSVNIEVILYALLLSSFIGIVILVVYLYKGVKHLNYLESVLNQPNFQMDQLPESYHLFEEEYQLILSKVMQEHQSSLNDSMNKYNDLMDITTLWAHQIKTPISAMRLLLQINEIEENQSIKEELFEIEKYVSMLLGYYRLNSETNDFVIRKVQCEPIIRSIIREYAKFFIRKKIQIELENINITVLSDEKWLSFVIEQVLSNALKYTSEGKIKISSENETTLIIEDTGIGIQVEDLPRIFEKGYTGFNGRRDKKSTGLGLYLCKMILSKLGHLIEINSTVNKGTIVKIHLDGISIKDN